MENTLTIYLGILLGCFIAISWFAGSDAPFIPTKIELIKKVLRVAGVKKGKKFYELGSGDGRVVLEAARMGAESMGIEQSVIRVLYSKFMARKLNLKNSHFLHADVFNKNYSGADIVYIYLLPKGVNKLEQKLKKELKKESVVITQAFHFSKWKPFKKIEPTDIEKGLLKKDIKGAGSFWLYRI